MKDKSFILAVFLFLIGSIWGMDASANPPDILWYRIYGGNGSDYARSVEQTFDGGYVFAGNTTSFGSDSNDVYIVKTDSQGDTMWTRLYGGADYDAANSVHQTVDGGYIIAGDTRSFGAGDRDLYLMKTDSCGDTVWSHTYGHEGLDEGFCVQQTNDSGYIFSGWTEPFIGDLFDMYLVKTNGVGDTLWTRTYGGNDDRAAYSVEQTSDGGYIVAGCNPFYGGVEYDAYLVKTDSIGDTLWTRSYGGSETEGAIYAQQTSDEGYIVAGYTRSFGAGLTDIWILKTDNNGDTLWTRTYGGSNQEGIASIRQIADGGYIILGNTSSYGAGGYDLYLIRTDSLGDTLWTLVYGGPDNDTGSSLDLTEDCGYIVAGYVWNWELPADCFLLKTGPDTSSTHAPAIEWVSHPKDFVLHPAYPNPFNPLTTISFDLPFQSHINMNIYNILGERVVVLMDGILTSGNHQIQWNASDFPSGIYFCRMQAGGFQQVQKLLLLK